MSVLMLMTLIGGLAWISAYQPCILNDTGNSFLKNFVDQEFLSFLGVIVTITLASAANMHLEFNRLEEEAQKEAFADARQAVKCYAALLLTVFALAFILVVLKPICGVGHRSSAVFNSFAIVFVTLSFMSLADLTLAIFNLKPRFENAKHQN